MDPLDQLAEEQHREQAHRHARGWWITFEEFRRQGFGRRETIRLLVAFAGRPPGLGPEDAQALMVSIVRAAGGDIDTPND